VDRLDVQEKETQPPRHYDDATLLAAMKNAGREIEDDALASAMKASGLGTPATRAEIIEKLIRTHYVERQRKQLRATAKGIALIGLVAPALRSPELTAEWEQRLKDVEQGELAVDVFYRDIVVFLRDLVPQIAQGPALSAEQVAAERTARPGRKGAMTGRASRSRKAGSSTQGSASAGATGPQASGLGICPLCRQGEITETARAFGCSRYREGCGLTIWKTLAGLTLTEPQVRQLLEKGRLPRIDGFRSKTGKPFSASLHLDPAGRIVFDFAASPADDASEEGRAPPERTRSADQSPARMTAPSSQDRAAQRPSIRDQPPTCPKCGLGRIIEGRRGFGCDRFREGCDFVVWKTYGGRALEESDIRSLIERGKTRVIDGIRDGTDQPCPARLCLDASWQVVTEPVDTVGKASASD
jgi:DNA topoisomerase III